MTIFSQMTISEHTGHGVSIIVKKYGKEAFEIFDKFVKITIPFDPEVMESVGNNVGNNQLQNDIIAIILENDRASAKAIAERLNLTARTIERAIAELKVQGIIERVDSTRGKWIVKKY